MLFLESNGYTAKYRSFPTKTLALFKNSFFMSVCLLGRFRNQWYDFRSDLNELDLLDRDMVTLKPADPSQFLSFLI